MVGIDSEWRRLLENDIQSENCTREIMNINTLIHLLDIHFFLGMNVLFFFYIEKEWIQLKDNFISVSIWSASMVLPVASIDKNCDQYIKQATSPVQKNSSNGCDGQTSFEIAR